MDFQIKIVAKYKLNLVKKNNFLYSYVKSPEKKYVLTKNTFFC